MDRYRRCREHRRDAAQLVEYLRAADIAGVDDQGAAAQRCHRLLAQQSVGVGDDADVLHGNTCLPGSAVSRADWGVFGRPFSG
jgi:hypothetical protein